MTRYSKIIAGVGALVLWMVEMQVPATKIIATGDRVYIPSVEWVTWLSFLAGVTILFAARKKAKHPRRLTLIASIELLAAGLIALSRNAPQWMAIWNFAFSGAIAILAALTPNDKLESMEDHPEHDLKQAA